MAEPVREPEPARRRHRRVGLVHGLSAVADHPTRRVVPHRAGRRGDVEGLRRDRHRGRPHRTRQAGGRHLRLGAHPQRRRSLRPHQHPDRPGVRYRGGVPQDVRDRHLVRRHDHRRRGSRSHRQGRRLPARRDALRRLPRHLPHGRGRSPGLARAPGHPRRRRFGQHRRRDRGVAGQGRLHHRQAATRHLLRRGRQGDQLERHPARARSRRGRTPLGLPALLQGRSAVYQLAGSHLRGHADGDGRRPAFARRSGHRCVAT